MNATPRRELPVALRRKLEEFRRHTRRQKLLEAGLLAALGLLLSFLLVFALDRLVDAPPLLRAIALVAGVAGFCVLLPIQACRWVLGTRTSTQVARVIARKDAATGDRLLGVVELVHNDREFDRSPVLCEAAIRQVDTDLADRDTLAALPRSRHRAFGKAVLAPAALCLVAFAVVPKAAGNAVLRWLLPFGDTARFTFARIESLPDRMVVAKGEDFDLRVQLADDTDWQPANAAAAGAGTGELVADLQGRAYVFRVHALTRPESLSLSVGDHRQTIALEPVDRPAIASLDAEVRLPDYLGIPAARTLDSRAGVVGVVEQSRVALRAEATRELRTATADGAALTIDGRRFTVPEQLADRARDVVVDWTDVHGLHGQQPMTIAVRVHPDAAPSVHTDGLRHETVLLVSDTLSFRVEGADDYGVRRLGLQWEGIPDAMTNPKPCKGDKVLVAADDGEQLKLTAEAAFCPELLGVPAQPLQVCAWVEDALPGRPRVTSTPMTIYVMTPDQHMIWLTQKLTMWDDEAREVHERELALYDENLALRALGLDELDKPQNRRRLEVQSRAERANSTRLSALLTAGQSLLTQAARNPEFNAQSLVEWAEMMKALQDIAASRMPSVANLLASAAQNTAGPNAGVSRIGPSSGAASNLVNVNKLPGNPSVSDNESTMLNDPGKGGGKPPGGKVNRAPPPLRLAQTTLQGKSGGGGQNQAGDDDDREPKDDMTPEELAKAIEEQRLLLAEFARLQGEFGKVLAALTGSTFVKRFKAESREQGTISGEIRREMLKAFGSREAETGGATGQLVETVTERENRSSTQVSLIQEDLTAFVDRLEGSDDQQKFKTVLEEMRDLSPAVELADLSHDVQKNLKGDAVADTEFWSDKLDYWGEMLVGPG